MLSQVKWGEYKIIDIFDVKNTQCILSRDVSPKVNGTPYLCAGSENNAVSTYIDYDTKYLDRGNCIFIGGKTLVVTYQKNDFYSNDSHNLALYLKSTTNATRATYLFLASCVYQGLKHKYTWGDSISYKKIQADKIKLPTKNGEIDFDFMERFVAELEAQRVAELEAQRVAELEAYLTATGLKDYELTAAEQKALDDFENQRISWKTVTYQSAFDHIKQGRRLKKEDQLPGTIPFVMAGTTNTGVVNYISNPVASFSKNSITIDIFGNAFYRNYAFGAGDDTGVYWNTQADYTSKQMLFFTSSMEKSIAGKFSYGKKLRSSQSLDIKMYVPVIKENIDLNFMDTLISAIQKLIIKDVVQYSDRKIAATKQCCKTAKI